MDSTIEKEVTPDSGDLSVLEAVIGHALVNDEFRSYLLEDPQAAVESAGYELSPSQVARLKSLNPAAMRVVLAAFDEASGKNMTELRFW